MPGVLATRYPSCALRGVVRTCPLELGVPTCSLCLLCREEGVRPSFSGGESLSSSLLAPKMSEALFDERGVASPAPCRPALMTSDNRTVRFGLHGESISASLNGSASNRPSTRPSRCGVGPMDVGTTGENSFRLRDGVVASRASTPAWSAEGVNCARGLRAWYWRDDGVSAGTMQNRFVEGV